MSAWRQVVRIAGGIYELGFATIGLVDDGVFIANRRRVVIWEWRGAKQ